MDAFAATLQEITSRFAPPWEIADWSQGALCWRSFRPPAPSLPHQGWKIHVSAAAVEAADFCARVAPVLRAHDAAFKLPRTIDDVMFINSGDGGAMLMGKILTVYPADGERAWRLARDIDAVWSATRGPEVQSDVHVRPGSAVSLRYGVFGSGHVVTSSTGVREFALVAPDGALVADARRPGGAVPDWAPALPMVSYPPRPCPVALQRPLAINGRRYVPLSLMSDKATTKVFLGFSVDTLATVVVKVGQPGATGDARGVDVQDRLRKEFRILDALSTRAGLAPAALDWDNVDWPILVLEDFRGDLVSELGRSERLECLESLARTVAAVHDAGFVHGDVKLDNAIRRGPQVGLIDFELAEREGDVCGAGGTGGYLAPEVTRGVTARFSRDVYALGASVAQAVLGVPTGLLPSGAGRLQGLLELEETHEAAELVRAFCQPDPAARPSASAAAAAIADRRDALRGLSPAPGRPSTDADLRWCRRASIEAASLTHAYLARDTDGQCWRNEHFMSAFHAEGINIGAAGIVLGLATVDRALGRSDFTAVIRTGAEWLTARRPDGQSAGLFTGNAGVAVALAVAGRRLGNPGFNTASESRLRHAAADGREIDLFSGAAGVLYACGLLTDIRGDDWALEYGSLIVRWLECHARVEKDVPVWSIDPHSDVHYLGCAHGSAGIAMALACWGSRTGDQVWVDRALDTFQRIHASGRTSDGRAVRMTLDADRAHAVGTWCHGVAGYLWCMVNACGDHPSLRREIDWAVDAVCDSMTVGTPTYCHGLAGRLELWRMLGGLPRFRDLAASQAGKTVRALRLTHQKAGGRAAWCSDDPAIVTPDLWIGFLGPATALALHVRAERAALLSSQWLAGCART